MKTIPVRNRPGQPVTDEIREAGIARGSERSMREPHAIAVRYLSDRRAIELDFADNTAITLPVSKYPELSALSDTDLSRLELGFGGSALCIDDRDLHIAIAGLVAASRPLTELAASVAYAKLPTNVWISGSAIDNDILKRAAELNQLVLEQAQMAKRLNEHLQDLTRQNQGIFERASELGRLEGLVKHAALHIRSHLLLTEENEVQYWTRKLGVTEEQLRLALKTTKSTNAGHETYGDDDIAYSSL